MKISASGATDGGNIVLFWPDNLPEGIDEKSPNDVLDVVSKSRDEGKLIWFPADGDGDFNVDFYIEEPVPEFLASLCKDDEVLPKLIVSGPGYFGGMEYLFKTDDSLSRKYPGMIERVTLPQGTYAATVCRIDLSEDFRRSWVMRRCGRFALTYSQIIDGVAIFTVLGFVVFVFLFGIVSAVLLMSKPHIFLWKVWLVFATMIALMFAVFEIGRRAPWYRRTTVTQNAFKNDYPTFVVKLFRTGERLG